MIAIQVHHAIGKLPSSPLSDYVWETLFLGAQQETFSSQDDPGITPLVSRLLTRPDVIGVRLVEQAAPADLTNLTSTPIVAPQPGDVLATFGQ